MEQEKKNFYRFLIKKNDKIPIGIIRLGFLFLYHFLFFSINSSTQYYAWNDSTIKLIWKTLFYLNTNKNVKINYFSYNFFHQTITPKKTQRFFLLIPSIEPFVDDVTVRIVTCICEWNKSFGNRLQNGKKSINHSVSNMPSINLTIGFFLVINMMMM